MKKSISKLQIGCDVVFIPRFKKILSRTPAMRRRIFSPPEERGATLERLAGIFAAKEAVIKTGAVPIGGWRAIEIIWEGNGRPIVRGVSNCEISISHDGEYAMAVAIWQSQDS